MKKAQSISINTIIVAAIALIVLVIIIAIFTGRMGSWGLGLDQITKQECKTPNTVETSQDCPSDRVIFGKYTNVNSGEVCCKPVTTD
jgi:hypothetical protein